MALYINVIITIIIIINLCYCCMLFKLKNPKQFSHIIIEAGFWATACYSTVVDIRVTEIKVEIVIHHRTNIQVTILKWSYMVSHFQNCDRDISMWINHFLEFSLRFLPCSRSIVFS